MSKHLVLVLKSRESLFKLRVFFLQVFHYVLQLETLFLNNLFTTKLPNNPITQPLFNIITFHIKGKNVNSMNREKDTSSAACSLSPPVSSLASFDFLRQSPVSAPDRSPIQILYRKFLFRQLLLQTPALAVSPHRFQFL